MGSISDCICDEGEISLEECTNDVSQLYGKEDDQRQERQKIGPRESMSQGQNEKRETTEFLK